MNSAASDPVLIGLDWGTTSFRAFLIGAEGRVLDRIASPEGIMQVANQEFDAAFQRLVGPWLVGRDLPVLASGMITSKNGWVETPYATLPLSSGDLAQALVPFDTEGGVRIHFVTGASAMHDGRPDVMRGEETQIVGAVAAGLEDGLYIMPGTHSKWVHVAAGRITDFSTYMTGDVFAALKGHTILGTLMAGEDHDPQVFAEGVRVGLAEAGDLLHTLFHVRTLPLMGKIPQTSTADYLSGLLIGSEIASATGSDLNMRMVTIVGRNDLYARYEQALQIAGLQSRSAPPDIVAKGHFAIAKAAGLLT